MSLMHRTRCFGLVALLVALSVAGFAAPPNRIGGWFVTGLNLAWFDHNYGHDLGKSHPAGWAPSFTAAQCEKYFADLEKMKVRVLRVWAFEAQEGLVFDAADKMVTGLDQQLLTNCDMLMACAQRHRLKIYWALLNHLIAEDEKGKHMNILKEQAVRDSYIKNAAVPFVKRYAKHPAWFAVDVINEAEGAVGGINFLSGRGRFWEGCTWKTMQAFIKACATAFHAAVPGVKVTSTSGWHEHKNLERFTGLGLDFLDWHSYRDDGKLPAVSELPVGNLPVILGECGPSKKGRDDGLQNRNWQSYFNEARAKGYAGVLAWSYGTPGEESTFSLVNTDGSWRPAAKIFGRFVAETHDAGPVWPSANDRAMLQVINPAVGKILAMGSNGNPLSSWDRMLARLMPSYPYVNPEYALARFDELGNALTMSGYALLRKEASGDRSNAVVAGRKSLQGLASSIVAAVRQSPVSAQLMARSGISSLAGFAGMTFQQVPSAGTTARPGLKLQTNGNGASSPFGE